MAIPRVFVSSTCYDLKYIRENLKYFIKTIGYEPVLSDAGDVFYNPVINTHDSCLKEVATCQIFVLIIGGRFGGKFKDSDKSITNHEYIEAVNNNIPVFALVEGAVFSDHHLFLTNKKADAVFATKIKYPNCDSIKVFDFIDEVRQKAINNALFSFKDFSDIELYLKKQWAGMMFDFLSKRSQEKQSEITNYLLDNLTLASKKTEELVKLLIRNVDDVGAEEKIQDISNKVEAENFARLVLKRFEIKKLLHTALERLCSIDIGQSWIDFLDSLSDFRIEDIEEGGIKSDIVLFGPSSRGVYIGFWDEEGHRVIDDNCDEEIEKAYKALRRADDKIKLNVFKMLVNGL
jgi:hypothetical protein